MGQVHTGASRGTTAAVTAVNCADGEPAQQMVFGGTAGANADHSALIKNPVDAANLAISDVIEAYADIEVDAGTTGVAAFGVGIAVNNGLLRAFWGDYTQ